MLIQALGILLLYLEFVYCFLVFRQGFLLLSSFHLVVFLGYGLLLRSTLGGQETEQKHTFSCFFCRFFGGSSMTEDNSDSICIV